MFRAGLFNEIFQNQMLKVKFGIFLKPLHFLEPCYHSILKDIEISFEYVHSLAKTLLIPRLETS